MQTTTYKKIIYASLTVAISGILYGFLGYLGTKVLEENMAISTMLFWRFFIAGLWIFLFIINKSIKQHTLNINKRLLFFILALGGVGYAGASGFYFIASKYTGTGLAMVIFFSYPIIITLISWITHRKNMNAGTILPLIAMMAGLFCLKGSSGQEINIAGLLFAIASACCYAFYIIGSKRISTINIDSNIVSTIVCFGSAFIFFAYANMMHQCKLPASASCWIYLLTLGILATAIPIQLMLIGLKYISSMRASIISVLEPLLTLFVGIILLQEQVSHLQLLGVAIILASALIIQFQKDL